MVGVLLGAAAQPTGQALAGRLLAWVSGINSETLKRGRVRRLNTGCKL